MPAIIISVLSLVVSALAFYWNNVRISHKLSAVVDYGSPVFKDKIIGDYSTKFQMKIAIINQGNRPEAIIALSLFFETEEFVVGSPGSAPFISEPNSVQIFEIGNDMKNLISNLGNSDLEWNNFGFRVRLIDHDKSVIIKDFRVGRIKPIKETSSASGHVDIIFESDLSRFDLISSYEFLSPI